MVIPALVVGLLLLLPFLDRRPDRHFLKRPLVTLGFGVIGLGIVVLTYLGYKDTPAHVDPSVWGPLPLVRADVRRRRAMPDVPYGGRDGERARRHSDSSRP
jgi:quinol-cytochrome oxidoreductase complex cytochrome b subunit